MSGREPAPAGQGTDIDWTAIHRRLEAAGETLAKGHSFGPEDEKAILNSRAAALAKPRASDQHEGDILEVLEFILAGETFAIETAFIAETFPLVEFTPLFCTPPFVMGIMNVRGRIVSIVDLRRFFELPATGLSNLNKVIILSDGNMEFGMVADSIAGTRALPLQELQPSLPTLTGIREEFLRGVTADRLVLLEIGKILADKRLIVHEEVEQAQ